MTDSAAVGERVRRLRLASGIPQAQIAEGLGLTSNGLVSKIENGRVVVDEQLLELIAGLLGCSVPYLEREQSEVLATRPWLRAYADAPARVVESVTADNTTAFEFIQQQRLALVPETTPWFDGDLNDDHAIERFAEEVRAQADVKEGAVVRNAMRAVERLGCIVLPLGDELGRHLGMSQRIDGRPFIRVSKAGGNEDNPRVPGDRQRWTVIHELGHLCLHAQIGPPESADEARKIERQAHRFAAAFLAPAEPLLDDWHTIGGRVTLRVLEQLKGTWGVAIKALVTRFRHLGIIGDEQARSLYRQIAARGWSTHEPTRVSNEEPVWFGKALMKAYPAPAVRESATEAAAAHGIGADYVLRWLDWSNAEIVGGTGDVIPFTGSGRSSHPRRASLVTKPGNARLLPPRSQQ